MEVAASLIKLNLNSKSKVNEWRDTMTARMDEVLAILVHEEFRSNQISEAIR